MTELKKKLSDQQAKYEPLISSDEEKKDYQQYQKDRDAYFAVHAKTLFKTESSAAFNTMIVDLVRSSEINRKGAAVASALTHDTYAQARVWVIAQVVVSIILAALVEEMAAAASSLKSQAQELVQTVAVFKLSGMLNQKATAPVAAVRSHKPKLTPQLAAP